MLAIYSSNSVTKKKQTHTKNQKKQQTMADLSKGDDDVVKQSTEVYYEKQKITFKLERERHHSVCVCGVCSVFSCFLVIFCFVLSVFFVVGSLHMPTCRLTLLSMPSFIDSQSSNVTYMS